MATSSWDNPKIARLYADVPSDQLQRLRTFRQKYPYRETVINGEPWRYIDTLEGEYTILVLAGGTTIAEVSFTTLEHLAGGYRVIAPDYPPIKTLAPFFDSLLQLLDQNHVDRFVLMGGSYGGWIAQSLVRYKPDRVEGLVLSAIGPPDPENSRQLSWLLPFLRLAPMFLLRALINRSFGSLESDKTSSGERLLLWALIKEIVNYRVTREDFVAAMERLVDQTANYSFLTDDLQNWSGRILVLFGSEDPATPPERREAMQQLYPSAELVLFEGGEHGIALSHKDAYYAAIDNFLRSLY